MKRFQKIAIALVSVIMLGHTATATAQEEEEKTVATNGAWEVRCIKGAKPCVMVQVGKTDKSDKALEMRIIKLADAKAPDGTKIPAAIQILTPTGIYLPAGVRIKIDTGEERTAAYETCVPNACVMRQPLSEAMLEEFRKGTNAQVTIRAADQDVVVKVSLNGFTKSFNAL